MFWGRARRLRRIKKLALLGIVLGAVAGGAVAVASASSPTVWIGTSGPDTIDVSGQQGGFHLWGLAGADDLTGGGGDNLIVGDGLCPYDNPVPTKGQSDSYCETAQVKGDPGDILRGGTGANTIFGGGGPNLIVAGPRTKRRGPFGTGNLIYGGPVGDAVDATAGSSTVYLAHGYNVADTVGPGVDHVLCERGDRHSLVLADPNDVVHGCAHVVVIGRDASPEWAQRAFERQVRCVLTAVRTRHALDKAHCGANVR